MPLFTFPFYSNICGVGRTGGTGRETVIVGRRARCHPITRFALALALSGAAATVPAQWLELPATGQVKCWDENGVQRKCAGTGEDGETRAGVAWSQAERFEDRGNGTVRDRVTKLIWLKDIGCINNTRREEEPFFHWQSALDAVKALNEGDLALDCGEYTRRTHDDWRLPNVQELNSVFLNAGATDVEAWLREGPFVGIPDVVGQFNGYLTSTTVPLLFATDRVWIRQWPATLHSHQKAGLGQSTLLAWPVRGTTGRVARTGQTDCWDSTGYRQVECVDTGQDGEMQAGALWPRPRFRRLDDGTFIDALTGLMWLRNPRCFSGKNWQEALDAVRTLNTGRRDVCTPYTADHTDWRLPNVVDMLSLMHQKVARADYGFLQELGGLRLPEELADVLAYVPPFADNVFVRQMFWTSTTYPSGSNSFRGDNPHSQALVVRAQTASNDVLPKLYESRSANRWDLNAWPVRNVDAADTAVQPDLNAYPETLEFGPIPQRTLTDRRLTLRNAGVLPLELNSVSSLTPPFSVEDDNDCRLPDAPGYRALRMGESCTLFIRFWPSSLGNYQDSLAIASGDPDQPLLTIPVTGESIRSQSPDVVVTTAEGVPVSNVNFDFGTLGLGEPPTVRYFDIHNEGIVTLEVYDIRGLRAPFQLNHDCTEVESQAHCRVRVEFRPTERQHIGNHQGHFDIYTNDPGQGEKRVFVHGTASQWASHPVARIDGTGDFGSVALGDTASRRYLVSNRGRSALVVSGVTTEPATLFALNADSCTGTTLSLVNDECEFQVIFTPDRDEQTLGQLLVSSNDPSSPGRLQLSGRGLPATARIAVRLYPAPLVEDPDRRRTQPFLTEIDFGVVAGGNYRQVALEIENRGGAQLMVHHIDVVDPTAPRTTSPPFDLAENHCTGQLLARSQSCRVLVRFTAPAVLTGLEIRSQLRIISNDPVSPSVDIALEGTATPGK